MAGASIAIGIAIAALPSPAFAGQQPGAGMSSLHSGTVRIDNDRERALFNSLRCMCGTCARDLLSTCTCDAPGGATEARENIRAAIARGDTDDKIIADYTAEHGTEALAVPPNSGAMRFIYALPLVAIVAGGAGVVSLMRRWKRAPPVKGKKKTKTPARDAYDDRLDEELRDLDG